MSQPKVLIVDDNEAFAVLLQKLFHPRGVPGRCGVFRWQRPPPLFSQMAYDVAVVDVQLPDGSGDALLDQFRSERPGCVCIMITGHLQPEASLDWMKRGAAAYLCKPFDPRYLVELCSRARRERALMRVPRLLEMRTRELQASEERLASVLKIQRELICRFKPDTRLTFVNPPFAGFFGKPEETMWDNLSSRWFRIRTAPESGRFFRNWPWAMPSRHLFIRSSGKVFLWHGWSGPVRPSMPARGRFWSTSSWGGDISDRKRVEERWTGA